MWMLSSENVNEKRSVDPCVLVISSDMPDCCKTQRPAAGTRPGAGSRALSARPASPCVGAAEARDPSAAALRGRGASR